MDPSPTPKFDNPKMDAMPALQLFGAGREKRIFAIPPYTEVKSLDFDDHPFELPTWDSVCAACGAADTYLDEVILAVACLFVRTPTTAPPAKRPATGDRARRRRPGDDRT